MNKNNVFKTICKHVLRVLKCSYMYVTVMQLKRKYKTKDKK